jgi:hypothetical protein
MNNLLWFIGVVTTGVVGTVVASIGAVYACTTITLSRRNAIWKNRLITVMVDLPDNTVLPAEAQPVTWTELTRQLKKLGHQILHDYQRSRHVPPLQRVPATDNLLLLSDPSKYTYPNSFC